MADKIYITKVNGLYKGYTEKALNIKSLNIEENLRYEVAYETVTIQHHYRDYRSRGRITIDFESLFDLQVGNFILKPRLEGKWETETDFRGPYYTLGWEIKDTVGETKIISFSGGLRSVIPNFLNSLTRFDSLSEYCAMEQVSNSKEWNLKDTADKICALDKIIELYKKYKDLNPVLQIVAETEDLIENRLKDLLK